jgi:predicted DNA-binding protein (MmcQ/YjbR family)
MTHKEFEEYIFNFPHTWLDYPFGEGVAVYKIGQKDQSDKMFALIAENSSPLRISLKCDPLLSEKLQQDYETVMPGYHLNKKHWITIICSGQVPEEEIKSLITLSYNLVSNEIKD